MKGLLLKDLYAIKEKAIAMYLCVALFLVVLAMINAPDGEMLLYVASMLCGMIPISLLGMDERSDWLVFALALPYSKKDLVTSKYLLSLIISLILLILVGGGFGIALALYHQFSLMKWLITLILVIVVSQFSCVLSLPFCYGFGMEKGRMWYYIMVLILSACSYFLSEIVLIDNIIYPLIVVVLMIPILIFISYKLSIKLFEKREL